MTQSAIDKAHTIYTGLPDWFYNTVVYRINTPFAWGSCVADIDAFYKRHIRDHHMEVGLASSRFIVNNAKAHQKITLLDINPFNLEKATQHLQNHYQINSIVANILEPIKTEQRFDSIAMNYILHCLPGNLTAEGKGVCFKHLSQLLNNNGVLFGATILGQGVEHNAFGQFLMKKFNEKGIFNNQMDSLVDLHESLEAVFNKVDIQQIGRLAFFVAYA